MARRGLLRGPKVTSGTEIHLLVGYIESAVFPRAPLPVSLLPENPVELTIERLGQLGEGVTSWQGRTVFVPGAFPGDVVSVQLEQQGKVLRGALQQVVTPGKDRR